MKHTHFHAWLRGSEVDGLFGFRSILFFDRVIAKGKTIGRCSSVRLSLCCLFPLCFEPTDLRTLVFAYVLKVKVMGEGQGLELAGGVWYVFIVSGVLARRGVRRGAANYANGSGGVQCLWAWSRGSVVDLILTKNRFYSVAHSANLPTGLYILLAIIFSCFKSTENIFFHDFFYQTEWYLRKLY